MNSGAVSYELAFVKSPIFLNDGIASELPGATLPLIAITQSMSFAGQLLSGNISLKLQDFYATFEALPGATLHNNQIGSYPFANQKTAANAIIAQPLTISMKMNCTPRLQGGIVSRVMTAMALKIALDNHNFSGGTYTILTPSFLYTGCIMTGFKDITSSTSAHKQTDWQIDFIQPLISEAAGILVQNEFISKITGGVPITASP